MTSSRPFRVLAALAFLPTLLPACFADVRTWDGGGDGRNWEDNCNWSGDPDHPCGFQPFDVDGAVIPAGTSPFPEIRFVEGINTLEVDVNTGIDLNGVLAVHLTTTNHGLITIADDGRLQLDAGSLDGSGTVLLADSTDTHATIAGAPDALPCCVTHAATHTIRGEGTVAGDWINYGQIVAEEVTADSSAALVIRGTMTNHGIVRSSSSSSLTLNGLQFVNAEMGQLVADTTTIIVGENSQLSGRLTVANAGKFVHAGTSQITLNSVTIDGDFDVITTNGGVLATGTGIVNHGTMVVDNSGAANAEIAFSPGTSLSGSGQVILNRANINTRITGGPFTHAADHTIRGVGRISASFINEGSIFAEPRIGTALEITSSITNQRLLQANADATLRFASGSSVTQNSTGRIRAQGAGTVELQGTQLTGGRLESEDSGLVIVSQGTLLTDVTNEGTLELPIGQSVRVAGNHFTNHGTLTLNPTGTSAPVPTRLTFESNLMLQGTGTLVLNQSGNNARIDITQPNIVTQAAGHTIQGKGLITGQLVNHGRLEGLSSSELLEITAALSGDGLLKDVKVGGQFVQVPHTLGDAGATAVVPAEGQYELGRNTTMLIDLGGVTPGSGHDQLRSSGPISLSSTATRLEVSLMDGYIPSAGDRFTVLTTTDQLSGHFGTAILPTKIPNYSLTWQVPQYTEHDLTLELLAITPRLGDFDGDGLYACQDIDMLVANITGDTDALLFDMNGDNVVDQTDLTQWLTVAGAVNLPSGNPYLAGDANLDGIIDEADFDIARASLFTSISAWCEGDFNADGFVDGSDFHILNSNKFKSSAAAAVPEPASLALVAACGLALLTRRR